jgi:hypothetical protein
LKWDEVNKHWECSQDIGAGGAGISVVRESDGSPSVSSTATLEFGPATLSESEFVITNQGSNTARVVLGSSVAHIDADESISGAWTFSGNITANDVSADTILIGQNGTNDDTVTIAGNVSIVDDNWSISAGILAG